MMCGLNLSATSISIATLGARSRHTAESLSCTNAVYLYEFWQWIKGASASWGDALATLKGCVCGKVPVTCDCCCGHLYPQ